jgi:hypothetical protein
MAFKMRGNPFKQTLKSALRKDCPICGMKFLVRDGDDGGYAKHYASHTDEDKEKATNLPMDRIKDE